MITDRFPKFVRALVSGPSSPLSPPPPQCDPGAPPGSGVSGRASPPAPVSPIHLSVMRLRLETMNRERGLGPTLSGYREQRETATTGERGPAVYNLFANSYPTLDCIKPPQPLVSPPSDP